MQRLVVGADGTRQQVRYFPGVGTGRWERLRGGALGVELSRSVHECWGPLVRRIGTPPVTSGDRVLRTHETVHSSTLTRHRRLTTPPRGPYRPSNLLDHLASLDRAAAPEQRDGGHERARPRRDAPSAG